MAADDEADDDDDEDDEEEPPEKKPAKKAAKGKGAFPDMDPDDKASLEKYVKKALEFNDNEIDINELIRLCKTKGIVFENTKDAYTKLTSCGFNVDENGVVTPGE